tara:strand:+ start:629 stop:889 length:261 start_codon:yes stop_codon:yes gene_type:complete
MSLALTFIIPSIRSVQTRAITDPSQYDTEINAARGFKPVTLGKPKSKSKVNHTIRVENGITYDPDQYDTEENVERHILQKGEKRKL